MTIIINQKCDSCGESRILPAKYWKEYPDHDGWREVAPGKHACGACIKKMISE